jgi:uncharacterized protein YggE
MKWSTLAALVITCVVVAAVRAQTGGNIGFAPGGGKARAEQADRSRRALTREELPPTDTCSFVEAAVLMNVKADEFVAVFSVAREGATPADCAKKMDETVTTFTNAMKPLGIREADTFVDYVTQTKIYGYQIEGELAREKLVGFELTKNVSVRYKDHALIDRLVDAAARSDIFDLVKVDYHVSDPRAVRGRLAEAAAAVIKRKRAEYEALLGVKLKPPGQVYADRSATHYPSRQYDAYSAFSAENMSAPFDRQKYAVQSMRKSHTFFFNGLDGGEFDEVISPVVLEPVVQFTLYLKVKYQVEQDPAR